MLNYPTYSQWYCFRFGRDLSGHVLPPDLLRDALPPAGTRACILCHAPVSHWEQGSFPIRGGKDIKVETLQHELILGTRVKVYETVDVPLIGGGSVPELKSKVYPMLVKGAGCAECQYRYARIRGAAITEYQERERNTPITRQTVILPGTYDSRGIRVPTSQTGKRTRIVVPVRVTREMPIPFIDVMDRVLNMPRASHPREDVAPKEEL